VEIPLQYAVRDVKAFDSFASPERRDELLKAVAQREILRLFQGLSLDEVLGRQRQDISQTLRAQLQQAFDALNPGPDGKPLGAGVEVVFVGLTGVHPPKESAKSFELVVQTDQRREANIEVARGDEVKLLVEVAGDVNLARQIVAELDALQALTESKATPQQIAVQEDKIRTLIESAGGSASSALADASADRWQKHMGDRARASRYLGQVALHDASPIVYRASLYFDEIRKSVAGSRLYITSDEIPDSRVIVDLMDKQSGLDVFDPGKPQ
jgi:regulator of protease activity HflC (stomatin/prohibitin superfamily)